MNDVDAKGKRIYTPASPLSHSPFPHLHMTLGYSQYKKGRLDLLSTRLRLQFVCLFLVLTVCLSSSLSALVLSFVYAPLYSRDQALAHTGILHLRSAQHLLLSLQQEPFRLDLASNAQQEFIASSQAFTQLNSDIERMPPFLIALPFVGDRLLTARHLVSSASAFSLAGSIGCHLLQTVMHKLHNPLSQESQPLTTKNILSIQTDLRALHSQLQKALDELDHISYTNQQFGAQLDTQIAQLHLYEPQIKAWLPLLDQALPFLPQLMGTDHPAHYLVEVLDSSELRPSGGFIGNYGFLTISGGRLQNMRITDVDLLDLPFKKAGGFIPFPPAYRWFPLGHGQWSFRDSNLDADFPTSAAFGLRNFQLEGGNVPVQGVIAITPALMQGALKIIGPIAIPDYHDTINAQNLIERIHYYQLGAGRHGSGKVLSSDGLSSQRKHFTALLAHYFFLHLRHLSNSEMTQIAHLLRESLQDKDLQLYFPQHKLEAILSQAAFDSRIQQAPDSLFVVDANINGNKANSFIRNTVTDVVNIDNEGNATHFLTLHYAWTLPGEIFGNPLYRDYIQVYLPSTSQLQGQQGWEQSSTLNRSASLVRTGIISLSYGDIHTVQLSWIVPHAVQHDEHGNLHFRYLIQRQAGIERNLYLQVHLPACALIQSTSGAAFTYNKQAAWLSQKVTRDLPMSIDYTC